MTLRDGTVRIGRIVLGLFFVADGVIKLTGVSKTVQLFERIGWGNGLGTSPACLSSLEEP